MDLSSISGLIKSKFSPRKKVDFDESGIHFELEPLSTTEEMKVVEACKNFEDAQYINALKRHTLACAIRSVNGIELDEKEEYTNAAGVSKSKFLYLLDMIASWPTTLIDTLFGAFTDMVQGLEKKTMDEVKFERFNISEKPEEDKPSKLKKIVENEASVEGLTPVEKMNKQVEKELADQDIHRADIETERMLKK